MKKRLYIGIGSFLFFCLLIILPSLLTLSWPQSHIFSWLTPELSGTLKAKSCSLGWFSGLKCKEIAYFLPVQAEKKQDNSKVIFTANGLQSDKGLLLMLLAPHYLGQWVLDTPTVHVYSPAMDLPQKKEKKHLFSPMAFWGKHGALRLQAKDGSILLHENNKTLTVLNELSLQAESDNGSLQYSLEGQTEKSNVNNFHSKGTITLPPQSDTPFAHFLLNSSLNLDETRINDVPAFISLNNLRIMQGEGSVSGSSQLIRAVDGVLQLDGQLLVKEVPLSGQANAQDQSKLSGGTLQFQLNRLGKQHWQVGSLRFSSDLLQGEANGLIHHEKTDLRLHAEVSLPELTRQFRHSLYLHPDADLLSGSLSCSLLAQGALAELPAQLDCSISEIKGARRGAAFLWSNPLTLSAKGQLFSQGVKIDAIKAQGTLASLQVRRNGDRLNTQAHIRLTALSDEISHLADPPFRLGGTLQLMTDASWPKLSGQNAKTLKFKLDITDFSLQKGQIDLLSPHQFTLQGKGKAVQDSLFSAKIQGQSWYGPFDFQVNGTHKEGEQARGDYAFSGKLLLDHLKNTLQAIAPRLPLQELDGQADLNLQATFLGTEQSISDFRLAFTDLHLLADPFAMDSKMGLIAAGQSTQEDPSPGLRPLHIIPAQISQEKDKSNTWAFDLKKESLQLDPIRLYLDNTFMTGSLHMGLFNDGTRNYASSAHGNIESPLFLSLCRVAGFLPQGVEISGPVGLSFSLEHLANNTPPRAEVAAKLESIKRQDGNQPLFQDSKINLYAELENASTQGNNAWDIPVFSYHSPKLWAKGKGFLWEDKGRGMLALQGQQQQNPQLKPKQKGVELETEAPDSTFQLFCPLQ